MVDVDARILVLTPAPDVLDLARSLDHGALVLLAAGEELYKWRRRLASFENVMVTPGDRNEIPWQTAYFTLIVDPSGEPPTAEMLRVLAPETGRIVSGLA